MEFLNSNTHKMNTTFTGIGAIDDSFDLNEKVTFVTCNGGGFPVAFQGRIRTVNIDTNKNWANEGSVKVNYVKKGGRRRSIKSQPVNTPFGRVNPALVIVKGWHEIKTEDDLNVAMSTSDEAHIENMINQLPEGFEVVVAVNVKF